MTDADLLFERLSGYGPNIFALAAHGKTTRADYESLLIPVFDSKLKQEGRVQLLFVFGDDFIGCSPGAAKDNAKFGFLHRKDLAQRSFRH